jgi:hypothetical protein
MNVILGFIPRAAQLLILRRLDRFRFVTAVCHRRLGKTLLAVNWLIREGLEKNIQGYRGYYFSGTQKQAKIVCWQYFKDALAPLKELGLVDFHETELRVDLPNNGKIYLGSAESIENYRGIYIDRIVLDEIASWANAKYAYSEVLRPAMSDRRAHALIIGTVKGLDQFYDFYQYGVSSHPDYKDWATIDLKASMTGILPPDELAQLRATMSPDAYDRELENNFFAEAPDILISPPEAVDAMNREVDPMLVSVSDVVVGIDIGLTGDLSVVCVRQGLQVRPFHVIPSEDPMLTAAKIARYLSTISPRPRTIFGDAGQGMAVLSRIRDLGHPVIDVFFGSASDEINCFNKRAAMAYRVKQFLREGQIPHDEYLLKELVNLHLQKDESNRIRLIAKRKIKEIIGRSPDRLDALFLTFAEIEPPVDDLLEQAKRLGVSIPEMKSIMLGLNRLGKNNTSEEYDVLNYFNSE